MIAFLTDVTDARLSFNFDLKLLLKVSSFNVMIAFTTDTLVSLMYNEIFAQNIFYTYLA